MISYLKGQGYKLTTKDTLNNKEFRLVSSDFTANQELSTFGNLAQDTAEIYELFLSTRDYSKAKMTALLEDLGGEDEVVTGSVSVELQERGYLITLTFIIGA